MSRFFDRKGVPISLEQWGRDFEDREKQRVAETTLEDGRWISTVWIGLDHSFGEGPPLIFETMVFGTKDSRSDLDCERYSTEAEALRGHAAMVAKWRKAEAS